jgi:hypothetical protein
MFVGYGEYAMYMRSLIAAIVLLCGTNLCAETAIDTDNELFTEALSEPDMDASATVYADEGIAVRTPDGRRVLLMDDHTWKYAELEQGLPSESAFLEVENIKELSNACKIGFRLTNNLGYFIKSLVPSFSAYNHEGVLYDTVSKAFSSLKPTRDQYRQIQFVGQRCRDISYIQVHGAEHCHMGELDKFNEEEGECLSHIYVQASDLIKISK